MRPGTGTPRKKAEARRDHSLLADVTKAEKQKILDYCIRHKISVSQFLAELTLEDAARKQRSSQNDDQEEITIKLKIPRRQNKKLALIARLQQKSIDKIIQELLLPTLEVHQPPGDLDTETLRFYLSKEEHEIVLRHFAEQHMSARNYVSMLAMERISKEQNKKT